MNIGDKKLFINKIKLYQMVNLRQNGYAFSSLALLFDCDISSIRSQCAKYGIPEPEEIYTIERIATTILPILDPPNYKVINGERINLGKSYAEYLKSISP